MALLFALELFGVPSCTTGTPLEAEMRRTDALLAEGRSTEALSVLLLLRDAHPTEALLDRQVARAYAGLNRPTEEAEAWEAFLRKSPAPADACLRLGELFRKSGEPARFVAAAQQCLSHDPGQVEVIGALALAYEVLGNRAAADAPIAPTAPDGDLVQARAWMERGLTLAPDDPVLMTMRSRLSNERPR
jgi:predicted Zn-dependent protease